MAENPGGSSRKTWASSALCYSLVLPALLLPLLSGKVEPVWDARDFHYPAFAYAWDSYAEGRFPLWDPYTNCGSPFHIYPDYPTLNPAAAGWSFLLPDSHRAFIAYWAFLWWWGGFGLFWWARSRGAGPGGALVASFSYALSGYFIGHAEHTSYLWTAAWLPWIFRLAESAVASSNPGFSLLAGAAAGLSAFGGYAGLFPFTLPALLLWLALRIPPAKAQALKIGGAMFLILAICIAIWSPILNAFFREGMGYTQRAGPLPPETANYSAPFSLPALFSLLFPYATIVGREWMQSDISMVNGYTGIYSIPLASLWLLKGTGKRQRWGFLAYIVFMLLVSFGGQAGLRTVLYHVFPPLRFVDKSGIFRAYWMLPVSLLGGLGFSLLLRQPETRRAAWRILLLWSAIAVLAGFGLALFLRGHGVPVEKALLRLYLPAAVLLPAGLLVLGGWSRYTTGRASHAMPVLLVALACADFAVHLYNNASTVWKPGSTMKQAELLHKRTTAVAGEPGGRLPPFFFGWFNAQQVVKAPVVQGFSSLKSKGFEDVLCRSRFVEVLQSPRRFWISPGAEPVPSEETALSVLSSTGAGNAVPAFVEKPPDGLPADRAIPGSYGNVRILLYEPENIELEAAVPGTAGGFLNSTERYAPGWKAWVDGQPGEAMKANLFFRGLFVPPGVHRVTWKYEPDFWRPLFFLSAATLVLSVAAGALLLRLRAGHG